MVSVVYKCEQCGHQHRNAGTCPTCNIKLKKVCPNCGHVPEECVCN